MIACIQLVTLCHHYMCMCVCVGVCVVFCGGSATSTLWPKSRTRTFCQMREMGIPTAFISDSHRVSESVQSLQNFSSEKKKKNFCFVKENDEVLLVHACMTVCSEKHVWTRGVVIHLPPPSSSLLLTDSHSRLILRLPTPSLILCRERTFFFLHQIHPRFLVPIPLSLSFTVSLCLCMFS